MCQWTDTYAVLAGRTRIRKPLPFTFPESRAQDLPTMEAEKAAGVLSRTIEKNTDLEVVFLLFPKFCRSEKKAKSGVKEEKSIPRLKMKYEVP